MNDTEYYYTDFSLRKRLKSPRPKKGCGYDYPYTRLPPRRCLLEPVPAIYLAQDLLDEAANYHNSGDNNRAAKLIREADLLEIEIWTESIWGRSALPSTRRRMTKNPDTIPKEKRDKKYIPVELQNRLVNRDRYHCRWCGIPVIPKEVRKYLNELYPEELRWGSTNRSQHNAFQAMTLVEDHVIPVSRGGKTLEENLVVSCWPCNFGRSQFLPEEMCLINPDPNAGPWIETDWDGLTRVLPKKA